MTFACTNLHKRILNSSTFSFQVLTLRTVHEQLVRLLTTSERQALRTSEVFSPFSGLNPLHPNPYTEPLWRAAVMQYERGMAPAEQKIAGKLRQQLGDLSAKSHQVVNNNDNNNSNTDNIHILK